jgi:hypothetical protein
LYYRIIPYLRTVKRKRVASAAKGEFESTASLSHPQPLSGEFRRYWNDRARARNWSLERLRMAQNWKLSEF